MYLRLIAAVSLMLMFAGCQSLDWRFQSPETNDESKISDDDLDDDSEDLATDTKIETPYIGDYVTVSGLNHILLEGVGLVVGLAGTGEDPPPSMYRTALLDDMRRRGVKNPNQILQSPNTALVIVRAYLPPLIQKGENFDIEVRLPGNSEATSLVGGRLLECYLSEQAIVPGQGILEGHEFAKASGPILISTGVGDESSLAGVLRRGRILGGGLATREDRNLSLYVRNDFRSVRNTRRVADRVGKRFHHYDQYGLKKPMAEAKTDQLVVLKVHPKYKDNFPRYLQIIRNIAFRETEVAERVRIQKLQQELLDPEKSDISALRLEAIGVTTIPVLKTGLSSPLLECRFHSAVALTYLDDESGLPVLVEAAKKEPAFRVFALAAMATLDTSESHLALRELMNDESAETRYGAFRALWTLNKEDPFIKGHDINGEFTFHVLQTEGKPLVHLTHRKHAEVVLFGHEQRFITPIAASAGSHIRVNAAPGSNTITVSRYEAGKPDRRRVVSTRVADVIQTIAEFGASYPEVAQLLVQAEHQHNLIGRIEIDSLPQSGRVYFRPGTELADGTKNSSKTRIGRSKLAPNLYSAPENDESFKRRESLDEEASTEEERGVQPAGGWELEDLKTLEGDSATPEGNASLIDLTASTADASSEDADSEDIDDEELSLSKSWWRWDIFQKSGKP